MGLIDFEVAGGGRLTAISALQRFYPEYSVERKLLKLLNGLNQLGPRISAERFKRVTQFEEKLPRLDDSNMRAFLLHKVDQNGRVYVFNIKNTGHLTSVIKLGMNENAAAGLHHEAQSLKLLAGRTDFQIPELMHYEVWDGGCLLQMSAVPSDQSIYDKRQSIPEAFFKSVAKLRNSSAPSFVHAGRIDGWQAARMRASTPSICEIANEIHSEDSFEVAAAHRDLGSENLFCRPGSQEISDFTIIDWEFFTETAPAMTDRVSVWLGSRHRAFKGWGKPGISELADEFLSDFACTPGGKPAAVLALLHLAEMGIDLASCLVGERK
jgi:hypothetical protein